MADRKLIDDSEWAPHADQILGMAEELLKLEDHPGFKCLMELLDRASTITTAEFLDLDLARAEDIEEMKNLQNRVARPYVIRETIDEILRQAAEDDIAEEAIEE